MTRVPDEFTVYESSGMQNNIMAVLYSGSSLYGDQQYITKPDSSAIKKYSTMILIIIF